MTVTTRNPQAATVVQANATSSRASAMWRGWRALLQSTAGASQQDLARLDERAGMQYATLGLAFVLNLVILSAAWIKVGLHYFGALGVLVPGLAVPALFVLGLDRLVAMRGRPLKGELAGYNLPGGHGSKWEPRLRLVMALALASLTTFTFLLTLSTDSIRQRQQEDSRVANQALRQELTERIQATHTLRLSQAQSREQQLLHERLRLTQQLDTVTHQVVDAEAVARNARTQASMEAGGLENRLRGAGPRFQAQMQISLQNEQTSAALREQHRQTQLTRNATDQELATLRNAATTALNERNQALVNLDEDLRLDARYVSPRRGLFSDATAFVRLYADPTESLGRWFVTVLCVSVLFALEASALLALAINPSSPLDVLRMARHREQAAKFVAESEIAVASARASGGAVRVTPVTAGVPQGTRI